MSLNIKNPICLVQNKVKKVVVDNINMTIDVYTSEVPSEEEQLTFSVVNNSTTYYFPLNSNNGISFTSLNGLYDLTNSVYIYAPADESYVGIMPNNQLIYENSNGSGYVYGDSYAYPDRVYYTASNSGSGGA